MDTTLNSKAPFGALESKWRRHRDESKLVSPTNKRKFDVLVVGTGLAGASAAASLAELGYNVKCFCFQDSPRRAHSIAAQGGINAAKNYQNDGDSVFRLFYDEEFWQSVNVLGEGTEFNQALEQAGRVADFLEFAELMCEDALERNESCGAHFRTEYQTEEGDALRNDAEFCHVAAWQYNGPDSKTAAKRRSRSLAWSEPI
jgi:succinate dehydrogenase/fumarate reductase flavoprotein subunit